MAVAPELYTAVEVTRAYAEEVARRVKFDLGHDPDRYLLSYFATTIELTSGCLALVRAQQFISVPILARSVLEAWVDFLCLAADDKYAKFIDAAHDWGMAKVIDEAVSAGNQYLRQLGQASSMLVEREDIRQREAENKNHDIKKLQAKERFERAGLADMYYSVYNHLSAESHNDMRVLVSRHLTQDESGDVHLTLYRSDPPFVETSLFQILDILTGMAMQICKRFGVDPPDRTRLEGAIGAAVKILESQERMDEK